MVHVLIITAVIILLCIVSSKLLYKFGVPTLLIFIVLGMLFGSDGIVGIQFDNYTFAKDICSVGLIFIMFYGGFGTKWKTAKPVAVQSILLSTVGVVLTAALTGLFCTFLLKTSLLEGFLIGSVVASTDAASVFAILRSRKLNLKNGLASLLEVESGSNDPVAYMMTIVIIVLMSGGGQGNIAVMIMKQVCFGLLIGFILAATAIFVLKRVNLEIDGLYPIFVTAIAVLAYSVTEAIGGNGYLCVYIVGIMLGNSRITQKKNLVHYFDGLSWLMQIMLFFTLGLLSFPSQMPPIFIPSLLTALFIIFIARPAAVFGILSFFKISFKSKLFVSWVGLRGAASIVFAIYVITSDVLIHTDLYHMIFFIALFSVAVQGTFTPFLAKKLDLVEADTDSVFTTFTDYEDETSTRLLELTVDAQNEWAGKSVAEAGIPSNILIVMIKRKQASIIPKGSTKIKAGDTLVLTGKHFDNLPL